MSSWSQSFRNKGRSMSPTDDTTQDRNLCDVQPKHSAGRETNESLSRLLSPSAPAHPSLLHPPVSASSSWEVKRTYFRQTMVNKRLNPLWAWGHGVQDRVSLTAPWLDVLFTCPLVNNIPAAKNVNVTITHIPPDRVPRCDRWSCASPVVRVRCHKRPLLGPIGLMGSARPGER